MHELHPDQEAVGDLPPPPPIGQIKAYNLARHRPPPPEQRHLMHTERWRDNRPTCQKDRLSHDKREHHEK